MASAKELISRLFTGAKNVVNTLDRDKVSPGFQITAPRYTSPLQNQPQRPDFFQNPGVKAASSLIQSVLPVPKIPLRAYKPAVKIGATNIDQSIKEVKEAIPAAGRLIPGGQKASGEDLYNVIQVAAAPFTSPTQYLVGGGLGIASQGVKNIKQGKPIFEGYDESFAKGAAKAPFYKVASAINPLSYLGGPVGKTVGKRVLETVATGAGREGLEGAFEGYIRPLEPGETRGSAIISDILFGSAFGGVMGGLGQASEELKPFFKDLMKPGVDVKIDREYVRNNIGQFAKKYNTSKERLAEALKEFESHANEKIKVTDMYGKTRMVPRKDAGFARIPGEKPPWDTKVPGMVESLGVVPKKGKIPTKTSQDEAGQQLTRAVMAEEEPKLFKDLFSQWIGKRNAAETSGAEQGFNFTSIPRAKGKDVIQVAEGTLKSADPEVNAAATQYKATSDALFQQIKQQAERAGVKDLGYIENYVTHYWKQDPKQVQQVMRSLSKTNPSFKGRTFLTYKEGIEAGLTPKYDNPAQIMSEYVTRLEQTKANLDLFEQLRASGLVVPTGVGSKQPGFMPIKAPGFPMSQTSINGKVVEGSYYAPDSIARQINRIFSPEDFGKPGKFFEKTAKVSSGLQNVVLSGGVPGTPINAFSFAQVLKSITSGNIRTPLRALAVSLSPKKSLQYFNAKAPIIKEMELRNIPIRSSFNTEDLMGFQKTAGGYWDAAMSDPTFKRFMPAMQIDLYERIKQTAIRQGVDSEQAADTAAKAVQNFYGTSSTADMAQRTSLGEDLKTTFAFAPQFRESMINFWGNTLKSLKNPLALENRENVKFLVGSTITLAAMNHLNQMFNGHSMSENPQGKEDKLLIPMGDTTIGIPFLSSIATVPRGVYRIGKSLINLDLKNAGADTLRTFGSIPLKAMGELIMNEDYFGNQIYDQADGQEKKAKDIAGYLFKNNTHPWLKAGLEAGDKPLYQTISQAVEAPIRYYKTSSIENAPFWSSYDMAKKAQEKFIELRYKDPNEAILFYNENKPLIDGVEMMKEQVKGYYESGQDSTFLKNNGVAQTDDHVAFIGNDGKFHLIDKNFDYKPPKLTGLEALDKKLLSSATSEITAMEKNVLTLFENNMMTANEADKTLTQMAAYKEAIKAVKGSGKAKKPKKIAIRQLKNSSRKVKTGKYKTRRIKLQAIKSAKIKPLQVKPLTVNVKKYL